MSAITTIGLISVFLIYITSQHLLNWFFRIEKDKPSWESKLVLALIGFFITNLLFIVFIRWVLITGIENL